MQKQVSCVRCFSSSRARKRDFSDQAYSMLLAWGEIDESAIDAPICDECYKELRELLIERADETLVQEEVVPVQIKKIVGTAPITVAQRMGSSGGGTEDGHYSGSNTAGGTGSYYGSSGIDVGSSSKAQVVSFSSLKPSKKISSNSKKSLPTSSKSSSSKSSSSKNTSRKKTEKSTVSKSKASAKKEASKKPVAKKTKATKTTGKTGSTQSSVKVKKVAKSSKTKVKASTKTKSKTAKTVKSSKAKKSGKKRVA